MMMLWAWAGVPLGVYNIVEDFNIALRIQPQMLTLLSLVTWIQCYYYEKVSEHSPQYIPAVQTKGAKEMVRDALAGHRLSNCRRHGWHSGRSYREPADSKG